MTHSSSFEMEANSNSVVILPQSAQDIPSNPKSLVLEGVSPVRPTRCPQSDIKERDASWVCGIC